MLGAVLFVEVLGCEVANDANDYDAGDERTNRIDQLHAALSLSDRKCQLITGLFQP